MATVVETLPGLEAAQVAASEPVPALPKLSERQVTALLEAAAIPARVPRATYRLQLTPDFTFEDARAVVPYLATLGVSDVYVSPFWKARPGSTHGYDVDDYARLNPELDGEPAFAAFVAALRDAGMGLVADFVPNHMGIGLGSNAWWTDVLENGENSPYAAHFDIDWCPLKPDLHGKVLLPILGDHYGVVLESGELNLRFDPEAGTFTLHYWETPLPIAPPTYPSILRLCLDALTAALPPDDLDLLELQSIITALDRLPAGNERTPELIAERQREQIVAKRRIAELVRRSEPIRSAIEDAVAELNGTPGDPATFDGLDRLLEAQAYRLAFWRVAAEEINYRRFFAINELAAVRQEEPDVFAAAHALLLRLIGDGAITGVRIDHPDGLWDPAGYVRRLQEEVVLERTRRAIEGIEDADGAELPTWDALRPALLARLREEQAAGKAAEPLRTLYLVVEKILEHREELPSGWAVHGTTGYEFANAATGLFVDPANRKAFDDLYARYIGTKTNFADMVYACKHLIMRVALASEVAVLANALDCIAERNRRSRDFTLNNLRDALREVIACFPVYRTYLVCEDGTVEERDRKVIEAAVALAKRRSPATDASVFDFLQDVLLMRAGDATEEGRAEQCRFGMKFQQLTGPVMAKGLEDTAFYRYNRLTSLNEVGGDPTQFGLTVAAFHRQSADRRKRWPHALLASSTHDTKRSEDVRARIDVLSELPREWRAAINRWTRLNRRHKTKVEGVPAPDRNDEYVLYQTLLGAWPFDQELSDPAAYPAFVDRMEAFLLKSIREAQVHTSWVNPNMGYDEATSRFVRAVLDNSGPNPFLEDIAALRRRVAHAGAFNALGQHLLKLTAPGVPDIYQGTELWDLSLVDPDNRRPVDYDRRLALLRDLTARQDAPALPAELVDALDDGRIKLFVTLRVLALRAAHPDLFATGDYVPLETSGPKQDHVAVFARRAGDREILVVVPRLIAGLIRGEPVPPVGDALWAGTSLTIPGADGDQVYRNLFTGETLHPTAGSRGGEMPLAEALATFPVAVLERLPASPAEGTDPSSSS